jgi:hypothetical protein
LFHTCFYKAKREAELTDLSNKKEFKAVMNIRMRIRTLQTLLSLLLTGSLLATSTSAFAADTEDQLAEDLTPTPAGMGSILVPSLTRATDEPEVVIYHRGERIASGPTGSRIAVPAGTYRVVLGNAEPAQMGGLPQAEVRVLEGETETVKPFYGALRVNMVNDDGEAAAGDYVLKSVGSGQVYGPVNVSIGAGAKPVPTWLLPPGRYSIVNGRSENATEGAVAVVVTAGEATKYRLVVDDTKLLRTEFGDDPVVKTKSIWRVRWLLGASGTLSRRTGTFTGINGDALFVNAFSKFEGGLNTKSHEATLRLNVDQSFIGVDTDKGEGVPVRALTNDVEGELLYNLRLGGLVGPYARALGRTSLLKTMYRPEVDVTASIVDENLAPLGADTIKARTNFTLLDSFAPLTLQEGAGVGISVLDSRALTLQVRGGIAARQSFYGGGGYITDRTGNAITISKLGNHSDIGGELTAIGGVRVGGTFSWETRFDAFMTTDQAFTAGTRLLPVMRWDNTVALRFGQFISAIYTLSLRRDELVVSDLQTAQLLALRLQYSVF